MHWDELPPEDVLARLQQLAVSGLPACSGFLDAWQWCPLTSVPGIQFAGGHPQAQFRRAALDQLPPVEIVALVLPTSVDSGVVRQLRQRLGRYGIPVHAIGDISAGPNPTLACLPGTDWEGAGLSATPLTAWSNQGLSTQTTTIAAARLDAAVAALFHVSRGEAQTAIKFGFVCHNWRVATKYDQHIQPGDQLVYRTKGRAELLALESNTRSGRLRVQFYMQRC